MTLIGLAYNHINGATSEQYIDLSDSVVHVSQSEFEVLQYALYDKGTPECTEDATVSLAWSSEDDDRPEIFVDPLDLPEGPEVLPHIIQELKDLQEQIGTYTSDIQALRDIHSTCDNDVVLQTKIGHVQNLISCDPIHDVRPDMDMESKVNMAKSIGYTLKLQDLRADLQDMENLHQYSRELQRCEERYMILNHKYRAKYNKLCSESGHLCAIAQLCTMPWAGVLLSEASQVPEEQELSKHYKIILCV